MSMAAPRWYTVPRALDRRFKLILGFSLLLHGALFVVTAWQRQPVMPELPPIVATLRLIAPPESRPPAAVAPAPAAVVPEKVRQPEVRRESRSSPRVLAAAGPANEPAPFVPEAAAPAIAAPAPATATPAPAVPAAPAIQAVPAADLLAAYRQRLTELLAGQREYPRIAALRGWEGEVRLRLRVARKGNLVGVVLDRSSGFEVLDQHALAMLAGLGNLPPLPEGLEGSEIQIVVPVNYKLNKTT
ncbi:MAG: TonB family protein [Dechloromonas sp.]|nr:TonB family protein [Dechloromonas sp.]